MSRAANHMRPNRGRQSDARSRASTELDGYVSRESVAGGIRKGEDQPGHKLRPDLVRAASQGCCLQRIPGPNQRVLVLAEARH